jgi:hypothetical protein
MIVLLPTGPIADAMRWRWIHDRWQTHGLPHRCECPRCKRAEEQGADVTLCEGCEQPAMAGASMCRDCWVDWYNEDPYEDEDESNSEEDVNG